MKPVVEHFEIQKNHFTKWFFAIFTLTGIFALAISWNEAGHKKWIVMAGMLLFGGGWLMAMKDRILVHPSGFDVHGIGKMKSIAWHEITALQFDMINHGHSAEARLDIHYHQQMLSLPVRQYRRRPMQRFFEVLHEKCPQAAKNEHFTRQATGQMNWRNKLKMY